MRFATEPCPDPQAFQFRSGVRAHSLAEFRDTLHKVPSDEVAYHRQHFHFWVRDVLQAPDLAEKVRAEGERNANGEQLRERLDMLVRNALPSAAPSRVGSTSPPPASGPSDAGARKALFGAGGRKR